MYEDPNPRAVVGNNALTVDEAISRLNRSGYMLARYETLAKAVRDERIDRAGLKVLAVLIATMNFETSTSWAGRETIASQTGMTPKSVSNYIYQLKCLGYIVSERRPTPQANGRVLMHYTISILSPEEIEAAVDWAVQCIRGEIDTVVKFPPPQEHAMDQFPSGRELEPESSHQSRNSLPVLTGTQGETSCPSGNVVPAPAGTGTESSRQDGRSNNTTTNITNRRARGEGGAEGEVRNQPASKASRGARLADDWFLPKAWGDWALKTFHITAEQVRLEGERFGNYWLSKAGQGALKTDWFRTWQNWCGDERKNWRRRSLTGDGHPPSTPNIDAAAERELREIRAITSGGR